MSDKRAQVNWNDDDFLDIDERHAKIRQLRAELAQTEFQLAQLAGAEKAFIEATARAQRAELGTERAEALAQLVNEETAELLERLADYARQAAHAAKGYPDDVDGAYIDEETTRALAASIREALALEANNES